MPAAYVDRRVLASVGGTPSRVSQGQRQAKSRQEARMWATTCNKGDKLTDKLRLKAPRGTRALTLAGASLVAPFSAGKAGAAEQTISDMVWLPCYGANS